jgi:hypothetical protein
MAADSSVVWTENFEEGSVAAVVARYDSHNDEAGMTLVTDHPASSSGSCAMELTSGGANAATDLYQSFGSGYNPPLHYPYPRAGQRPVGNDLYSIGLEPIPSFANTPMDFYACWLGMRSWMSDPTGAVGDYYGNTLLHDAEFRTQSDTRVCYEIHLKFNPDPTSGAKDKFCPNDASTNSSLLLDDMVVATRRIGCTVKQ